MSEVESQEVKWLWYPFIPYGKLTIIQGDPGDGKTTLVLNIAAKLSKGECLDSDMDVQEPVNVIYQTAEDGLADTVKPRLEIAGADCEKILVIDESDKSLSMADERLEEALAKTEASKMRDTIYSLAESGNNQIVCTTHSPYMIDLNKKPKQTLNRLSLITCSLGESTALTVESIPFNITKEFLELQEDDKNYIKMLLRVEDAIAKCFFVKKVLIIEGDTEQVVLSETISKLPASLKNEILSDWYILRARGKAAIIPLIKYLKAMHIDIYIMHDKDDNTPGAVIFNEPIRQALDNDSHLFVLENCVEDVLGYTAPTSDKPYKAYCYINKNWEEWKNVRDEWKTIIQNIFNEGRKIE